jgi:hypothetical protein
MRRFSSQLLRPLAAMTALLLSAVPLAASAADQPSADSLWAQHDSIAIDSPLYPLQLWFDGLTRTVSNDPSQRGFEELNQANIDLLNAYTLLQEEHGNGVTPVPVVDSLLAGGYDAITGSNARAPLGSLGNWITQSLLGMEGRGSVSGQVQALLQEYRAKQAVAVRDLHLGGNAAANALLQENAQREADFLARVNAIAAADDGITALLTAAQAQTSLLAMSGELAGLPHPNPNGNPKGKSGSPSKASAQNASHGRAGQGQGNPRTKGRQQDSGHD